MLRRQQRGFGVVGDVEQGTLNTDFESVAA